MAKSWGASIIAIVLALIAYSGVTAMARSTTLAHAIWFVPVIGAAVGAYLAPRHKFNAGSATFVPAAAIMGVGSYVAGRFGIGDFVGAEGTVVGLLISLPFIVGASVIGALIGEWASARKADV
jgi:hypothetical protein